MATARTKVVDLDEFLAEHIREAEDEREYIPIKIFGREWRVSNQLSAFIALQAGDGDPKAFTSFLMNVTHPDEQREFQEHLYRLNLKTEGLLALINKIMEVVAEHPTKSSSGSSRSAKTQAAKRKSAGS